jgi:hypothetical protein
MGYFHNFNNEFLNKYQKIYKILMTFNGLSNNNEII